MLEDYFTMEEPAELPVLCKQSRDLVVRLRKYFAAELQNGGPLLPLQSILQRVAHALRLDIELVEDIDKQYEKQKHKADLQKIVSDHEKRDVQRIIIHTNVFYKLYPEGTREELVKSLEEAGLFSGAYSALHELLVKSSYRIVKQQAKKIFKPIATVTSGAGEKLVQGPSGFSSGPTLKKPHYSESNIGSHHHDKVSENQGQVKDYELVTSIDVEPLNDSVDEKPELTDIADFCIESSQIDKMIKNTISDKPDLLNNVEKIIQTQKEENYDSESTLSADLEDILNSSFDENSQTHKTLHNYHPVVRIERMISDCVDKNMSIRKETQAYQNNLRAIVKHINEFYTINCTASHDDLLRSLKIAGLYEGSYSTLFTLVLQNSSYKGFLDMTHKKRGSAKRNKVCEMINSDHEYVPEKTTFVKKIVKTDNDIHKKDTNNTHIYNRRLDKKKQMSRLKIHFKESEQNITKNDRLKTMTNKILNREQNQSNTYTKKIGNSLHNDDPPNLPEPPLRPHIGKQNNRTTSYNIDESLDTDIPIPPLQHSKVYAGKKVTVKAEPNELPENNYMEVEELIDLAGIIDDTTIKQELNTFDECLEIEDSNTLQESFK